MNSGLFGHGLRFASVAAAWAGFFGQASPKAKNPRSSLAIVFLKPL